jgi:alpha-tubulin suppressor-like RCC1 family protein
MGRTQIRVVVRALLTGLVGLLGLLGILGSELFEDGGGTPSPPLASPSASLRVTPGTVFLAPGDATEVETTLTTEVSFGEDADLSVTALDTIEMSFAPAAGEASRGTPFRSTLSIRTAPTTAPGVYTVSVAADTVVTENPNATLGVVVLPVGGAVATGRVQAIAGGGFHSLALLENGTVWSWGDNGRGQLGDGTLISRLAPVQVQGLPGIARSIAAGGQHSLALLDDSTVWSWGDNVGGKLGDFLFSDPISTRPRQAQCDSARVGCGALVMVDHGATTFPFPDVVDIAAGGEHSMALREDGGVWTWGADSSGQLGRPEIFFNSIPSLVELPFPIRSVAGGGEHSLALANDRTVFGWGSNANRQLGQGPGKQPFPVEVLPFIFGVTAMGAGLDHSLFVVSDGTVRGLGFNFFGQLGDGTRITPVVPVQPPFLTNMSDVDGGFAHSLGLQQQGQVWAWGDNSFGQVGEPGDPDMQLVPVRISSLPSASAIAAGGRHSLALDDRCGQVWAWGDNVLGQLGDGTAAEPGERRPRPVPVYGLGEAALPPGCSVGLAVISQGQGQGTITTDPALIVNADCSAPCSAPFTVDSQVTITATPEPGSIFGGWHGDCAGSNPVTQVTMHFSRNCFVRFDINPSAGEPPQASFAPSPNPAQVDEPVVFDASASTDDGTIVAYDWDFTDDGTFDAMGQQVQFAYQFPGMFTARLRVTDDQGLMDETTQPITVQADSGDGDGTPIFFSITVDFRQSTADGIVSVNPPNVNLPNASFCDGDVCMVTDLADNETYTLTATPIEGSTFTGWDPAECDRIPDPTTCEIDLNSDRSVTALFVFG